jgi:hypothetical protein
MWYKEYVTAGRKKCGNCINRPRALLTAVIPKNRRKWTIPRRLPDKTLEVEIAASEFDQLGRAQRILGVAGYNQYREPRDCKHNAECNTSSSGAGDANALVYIRTRSAGF